MYNTTFFRIVALILVPVLVAGSLFFIFRAKPQENDSPHNGTTPNVQIAVPTDPTDPDFTVPDIQTPTDPHDPVDPDNPTEGDHILTPEKPGTEEDITEPTEPDTPTQPPAEDTEDNPSSTMIPRAISPIAVIPATVAAQTVITAMALKPMRIS